jgi:molybdopterin-guanine dinucleotide biosynthesis protein MobB
VERGRPHSSSDSFLNSTAAVSAYHDKHARDDFDIDESGKDSFQHRALGANEVVVASTDRLALVGELCGAPEPPLADLLHMLTPVDLVLIEGARREALAKIRYPTRCQRQKPPTLVDSL